MTPGGSALPAGSVLNNDFNRRCPGLMTERDVGNPKESRLQRQLRHFKRRPFRQLQRGATKRPGVQTGDAAKVPVRIVLPGVMTSRGRGSALCRTMRLAVQPLVQHRAHPGKSEQQDANRQKPA